MLIQSPSPSRAPKGKATSGDAPSGKGLRIAIVAARYNESLVDALLDCTRRSLAVSGVRHPLTVRVPGSYEIPCVVMRLARSRRFHALIALGMILQGKTSHADHIAMACAIHLQRIAVETGIPVIHQILTPRTLRDARARISPRGVEAAQAAIEMAAIVGNLKCKMGNGKFKIFNHGSSKPSA